MIHNEINIRPNEWVIVRQILLNHFSSHASVWVFGSRVKGTARKFSDLDLVIDINHRPLPLILLTQLLDDFEESDLPYKVDVVDWNTISDDFKTEIIEERIPLIISNQQFPPIKL